MFSISLRNFVLQAEDGKRAYDVTGVQTCALPICCTADPFRYLPLLRAHAVKLDVSLLWRSKVNFAQGYCLHKPNSAMNFEFLKDETLSL